MKHGVDEDDVLRPEISMMMMMMTDAIRFPYFMVADQHRLLITSH